MKSSVPYGEKKGVIGQGELQIHGAALQHLAQGHFKRPVASDTQGLNLWLKADLPSYIFTVHAQSHYFFLLQNCFDL